MRTRQTRCRNRRQVILATRPAGNSEIQDTFHERYRQSPLRPQRFEVELVEQFVETRHIPAATMQQVSRGVVGKVKATVARSQLQCRDAIRLNERLDLESGQPRETALQVGQGDRAFAR